MRIPEMNITLTPDGCEPIRTTLAQFLSDNADGIDQEEAEAIIATLERSGAYTGGGGAAPEFDIKRTVSHDTNGRHYAKLSTVKAGDTLETDQGFTCRPRRRVTLEQGDHGLFFKCRSGEHYIDVQADDGEHLIGLHEVAA